nr:AraC family transcriptional regulator [Novosphingobium panipatense]
MRSYGAESTTDRHGFAQIVLPLEGALVMEVGSRGGRIGRGELAFVETDLRHDQTSDQPNRSFILDLDPEDLSPHLREELGRRPFCALSPAANKLVDFMALMAAQTDTRPETLHPMVERWAPLLFETLAGSPPRARLRLAGLMTAVEAAPGRNWSAASMASHAGLGVSRLHELFRQELDTTPRAWLSELRVQKVREELGSGHVSIAELAYRFGYCDQSALTRAMRKATGMPPAAYRRRMQDAPSPLTPGDRPEPASKPA